MKKTIVLHDVPPSDLQQVLADLKSEGYQTAYYPEPDGNFAVFGTKEVPDGSDSDGSARQRACMTKKSPNPLRGTPPLQCLRVNSR